jgi:hypothetical protein
MLCLAVLLATAAAFGLHPEPTEETGAGGPGITRAGTIRLSASHLCVACLTHASALTAPLTAPVQAPQTAESAVAVSTQPSPPRLGRTPCSGLSPPSLS